MHPHCCQPRWVGRRRDVKTDLVRAAEDLIAERGVDAVSLREITAAAGATNASAVQYHFGGRSGLLRAIRQRHGASVETERHRLLDRFEQAESGDLRMLAAAFVEPLAAQLGAEGGPGYLQLLAHDANRPDLRFDPEAVDSADSTTRWRHLVEPLLDPRAVRLHRRFVAIQFTVTDLARRARNRPDRDQSRYTSHLIDLVTALLAAPLSDETLRLTGL